ncbi:phosphatidylinositol-glycan biosynthesis class W protein [Rhineura floridana]|uniref:phosphatidylinositol-glycan biosynthesis class W protein n=1 Tax=Rhineura floridana TaxID=261503 RepID=UPI002AC8364B|nr:phosphatidylinositol-glycan biosynthesis class W protein [Rhineura floridana]XP_061460802.1 phosphatidylinositol-glycan biosynthesis class W protein [Rhineura floridana]XP_061460803.1 phosphatidylinositol-glycan biosynthesis class W protein [Rhineura floridana]XP_061460805.1 phosphatidylinositol-glycan biosynthesis class W protein [Rhineura floridana]XP_061460806.1 phosphatidylinositol-glycan biosynthesis class W protein [Rhineura floridana]XP_061460807.1 phosphatidylinositol-glycan biosynt
MSQMLVKEDFISNLNGTTLLEISVGLPLAPLCLLSRGLLLILYFLFHGRPLQSASVHFLLDFMVLVVPPVFSCTVLASVLPLVILSITAFCVGLVSIIYSRRTNYVRVPIKQIQSDFLGTSLEPEYIPSITVFRVFINILTSISILAVDFPQYPRRYAKTETYGTGVMDFGVGAFVFGNAVVCPEVRLKPGMVQHKVSYLARQLFAVWPLLLLGFGRVMSVKAVEYYEHVSEYGVHWNFFFTLAIVRMAASLLLTVFPVHKAWIIAVTLAVVYEFFLDVTPLKKFILHGSDGQDSRAGFFNANREGIFSVIGYLAIYMASVQVGLYLLKRRSSVREWFGVICNFLFAVFLLFICLYITQTYIDTVSRRMANLSFCVWVVAHCLFLLSCFLVGDLLLFFSKLLVDGASIPCSWNFTESVTNKKRELETKDGKTVLRSGCLISAVNKNQLLYFLLANVLTGLVNMVVDTIHSNTLGAMFVLHLYMFSNCLVMHILQARNITLKWW